MYYNCKIALELSSFIYIYIYVYIYIYINGLKWFQQTKKLESKAKSKKFFSESQLSKLNLNIQYLCAATWW